MILIPFYHTYTQQSIALWHDIVIMTLQKVE